MFENSGSKDAVAVVGNATFDIYAFADAVAAFGNMIFDISGFTKRAC